MFCFIFVWWWSRERRHFSDILNISQTLIPPIYPKHHGFHLRSGGKLYSVFLEEEWEQVTTYKSAVVWYRDSVARCGNLFLTDTGIGSYGYVYGLTVSAEKPHAPPLGGVRRNSNKIQQVVCSGLSLSCNTTRISSREDTSSHCCSWKYLREGPKGLTTI